jgi:hypothetical protein
MAADCDTDHCVVVTEVSERQTVIKQTMHRFHMERYSLKKLNEAKGKEHYCVEISDRFTAFRNLDAEVDINGT